MAEESIVRENLMTREGYSPYCGNDVPRGVFGGCHNPRTKFNGEQFVCPHCKWVSAFPDDFILRYKDRWNLDLPGKIVRLLKTLPAPYNDQALKNYDETFYEKGIPVENNNDAVGWAFDWTKSPEGEEYWMKLRRHLENGEPL